MTKLDPRAVAEKMARACAPEGTIVQGSLGRSNVLRLSVVLRPRPDLKIGLLPLIASFSASDGLRKDTGIITWIRWPGEVVAGNSVIASTSITRGGTSDAPWVLLNFGINHGLTAREGETSLRDLLGVDVDQDMLVSKVADSLSWMYSGLTMEMYPRLKQRISAMLENAGQTVGVVRGGVRVEGIVTGVDEEGRLIVEVGTAGPLFIEDRAEVIQP